MQKTIWNKNNVSSHPKIIAINKIFSLSEIFASTLFNMDIPARVSFQIWGCTRNVFVFPFCSLTFLSEI